MSNPGYALAIGTTGLFLLTWIPTGFSVPPDWGQVRQAWFPSSALRGVYLSLLQVDDPTVAYTEYNLTF